MMLVEQELQKKLAQEQFNIQIINYKRKAKNFYKDIENFVKSGGDVDLVKLSDFFDVTSFVHRATTKVSNLEGLDLLEITNINQL